MEEYDPTDTERALALADIKAWSESLGGEDYHPSVILDLVNKKFTLSELIEDIEEGTALAEALLDVIMVESRKVGISPLEYTKRMMRLNTGKVVRGEFWFKSGPR